MPEAGFAVSPCCPGGASSGDSRLANLGAVAGLAVPACSALRSWCAAVRRWSSPSAATPGLPARLAAIVLRVPLVVVSYDAVPGAANRLVARFARKCAVAFGHLLPNQVVTGAPLRSSVLDGASAARRAGRRPAAALGFPRGAFFSPSRAARSGARRLNEAALGLARSWVERSDVSIYHVAVSATSPCRGRGRQRSASGASRGAGAASTTGSSATSRTCRPCSPPATSPCCGRVPRRSPSWPPSAPRASSSRCPGAPERPPDPQRRGL